MNIRKGKQTKTFSSAINSAALQDHMLQKLNFNIDGMNRPVRRITTTKLPSIVSRPIEIDVLQAKEKRSILPYESDTLKKLKEMKSDEEKMSKYQRQLTWAQRLGIVQAPPKPLTAADWEQIEEKSKLRKDSENSCSICLEDFRIEPQVILSCSHVFHMKCLTSYERHNQIHCCPICRRRDYEKKVIDEAIRAFTLKSIIRIQRCFRGSRVRIKFYSDLVGKGYVAKSMYFNRRLLGYRLLRLSQKVKDNAKKTQDYLTDMLANIQQQQKISQESLIMQIVQAQRSRLMQQKQIEEYLRLADRQQQENGLTVELDWQKIKEKGMNRKQDECAICLMALYTKPVYLLSCTHIFHASCIDSFERYSLIEHQLKCPCCRLQYSKKLLSRK